MGPDAYAVVLGETWEEDRHHQSPTRRCQRQRQRRRSRPQQEVDVNSVGCHHHDPVSCNDDSRSCGSTRREDQCITYSSNNDNDDDETADTSVHRTTHQQPRIISTCSQVKQFPFPRSGKRRRRQHKTFRQSASGQSSSYRSSSGGGGGYCDGDGGWIIPSVFLLLSFLLLIDDSFTADGMKYTTNRAKATTATISSSSIVDSTSTIGWSWSWRIHDDDHDHDDEDDGFSQLFAKKRTTTTLSSITTSKSKALDNRDDDKRRLLEEIALLHAEFDNTKKSRLEYPKHNFGKYIDDDGEESTRRRSLGGYARPDDDHTVGGGDDGGGSSSSGGSSSAAGQQIPYDCSEYEGWGDLPDYCQTQAPSSATVSIPAGTSGVDDDEEDDDEDGKEDQSIVTDAPSESPTQLSSFWQSIIEEMNDNSNMENETDANDSIDGVSQIPEQSIPEVAPVPAPADVTIGTTIVPPPDGDDLGTNEDNNDESNIDDNDTNSSSDDDSDHLPLLPPDIDNAIRLNVSMGIVNLHHLSVEESHTIVELCLRAITKVLNNYTRPGSSHSPLFIIDDGLDDAKKKTSSSTPIDGVDFSSDGDDRRSRRRSTVVDVHGNNNRSRLLPSERQSEDGGVQARLYLYQVDIRESESVDEWFVLYATYAVIWPGTRLPMTSEGCLAATEHFAGHVLDQSMTTDPGLTEKLDDGTNLPLRSNDFWRTLKTFDFGQELLLSPPPWTENQAGLGDCVKVGTEYDVEHLIHDGSRLPDREDEPDFGGFGEGDVHYDERLNGKWGIREWVGLTILSSTIFTAFTLSLVASYLQRQRQREEAWGAVLTEEGVGEILQVGWKYQEGMIPPTEKDDNLQVENDTDQQRQLYLQIYDKAKLGYNDENSMLQGGVEQQQYWGPPDGTNPSRPPTTTNTTETGTAMTPPDNNSNTLPPQKQQH
mmetsp:Transcript_34479/g.83182  ORF Transcript_34479/g.83182 Transcript_34479/m.83182 type:complete len:932 (+) Transcript_34479:346-3141(+)